MTLIQTPKGPQNKLSLDSYNSSHLHHTNQINFENIVIYLIFDFHSFRRILFGDVTI